MDDWHLLKEFVSGRSQSAFATLVERHIHFVYSTCLREVRDPALAEDVTQVVFLLLAKKAPTLCEKTVLVGWLYNAARFAARDAVKREMRRRRREERAAEEMQVLTDDDSSWNALEPLLHDALSTLGEEERNAVFLRFFEGKSLRETGGALGITEDAARMRVTRAVNKLKKFFLSRGFTVSGTALVALLGENAVQAAPASCASAVLHTAQCMTAGGSATAAVSANVLTTLDGTVKAMLFAKAKTVAVACLSLTVAGTAGGQVVRSHLASNSEVPQGISKAVPRDSSRALTARIARTGALQKPSVPQSGAATTNKRLPFLPQGLGATNGEAHFQARPITMAAVENQSPHARLAQAPTQRKVPVVKGALLTPTAQTETAKTAAKTQESQTLAIAGRIVGPDGTPVKAKINIRQYTAGMRGWEKDVSTVISTDDKGLFSTRIEPLPNVPDTVQQLFGVATVVAPGFVPTTFIPEDAADPKNPLTVKLNKGASISGLVKDSAGVPLPGVKIQLQLLAGATVALDEAISETPVFIPELLLPDVTAVTGADGRWSMDNVRPHRRAWFALNDPKWARQRIEIETAPGATQAPDIIARPGGTLLGKVTSEEGTVVGKIRVMASHTGGTSWGDVWVGADGSFEIPNLGAGSYVLNAGGPESESANVGDPAGGWVLEPITGVQVTEGAINAVSPLVMTRGALIEGQVTDDKTGQPLAGVSVNIGAIRYNNSATTDKKGRYGLRVVPGKVSLYVTRRPSGYLYPASASPSQQMMLTLEKGDTKTIDLKLQRGLELRGTVKVAGGQKQTALPDKLHISLREVKPDSMPESRRAPVKAGAWVIEGIDAAKTESYRLATNDEEWEVVSPKTVTVPHKGPVEVLLRHVPFSSLFGKVVTREGQPVEKVKIKAAISIPYSDSLWMSRQTTVESAADGTFSIPRIKADYLVTLSAARQGFKYVSGGETESKNGALTVQQIVMLPTQSRVVGRVIGADGKPVAGATVFSPDGNPLEEDAQRRVVSDAGGRFELTGLPEGEVTVIAAHRHGAATIQAQSALHATPATYDLPLRPHRVVKAPDIERAYAVLEDVWETSRGTQWRRRDSLPSSLVKANFALALDLVQGGDKTRRIPEGVLFELIARLCETDPARAVEWAPAQLPNLTDPYRRLTSTVQVGITAIKIRPELAGQLLAEAKRIAFKNEMQKISGLALLAAFEMRLGNKEAANQLADQAITLTQVAPTLGKTGRARVKGIICSIMAQGDARLALRVLDEIVVSPDDGYNQSSAYANCIEELAKHDVPGALQWMDALAKQDNPQASSTFARSAQPVIKALGKADWKAALSLARRVKESYRAEALLTAARFAPNDERKAILREAAATVPENYWNSGVTLSAIAHQAADIDAAIGKEMLDLAQQRIETLKQRHGGPAGSWRVEQGVPTAAAYAVALSRTDPMLSRILLEEEWAFVRSQNSQQRRPNAERVLATAMAAVDADRALEWSRQIYTRNSHGEIRNANFELSNVAGTDLTPQLEAQRDIALFLLAPSEPINQLWE